MSSTDPRPLEYMRVDAARNEHRIVEVAARLLGDDPRAGMAEVAAAAGVGRATVYRHFATREALIGAIQRQAVEHGEQALLQCRLEDGSAADALRRLVGAWLEVAERYAYPQLAAREELSASDELRRHQRRVFGEPLLALIERGQAAGEFAAGVPAQWATRAFGALILAGARAVGDGTLARREAPDAVSRTLLEGLRA